MLENNGKMSQAQEVRAQAFFMAMQTAQRREYDAGQPSPEEMKTLAEGYEAWLWEAEGANNMRRLVEAAEHMIELSQGGPTSEDVWAKARLELGDALAPFSPRTKRRRP